MCRNGPVSSSSTGSTPKTRVYQASLTDRSVTVTATCEMAGMVPEMNRPFPDLPPRRRDRGRIGKMERP
jgi:hypothetical protein